jgi:hypothetical protein
MSNTKTHIIECTACRRSFWTPSDWLRHKTALKATCGGDGAVRCLTSAEAEARVRTTFSELYTKECLLFAQLARSKTGLVITPEEATTHAWSLTKERAMEERAAFVQLAPRLGTATMSANTGNKKK